MPITHEQIVAARLHFGLNRQEAAKLAGVSYDTWRGWEKARHPINEDRFKCFLNAAIAGALVLAQAIALQAFEVRSPAPVIAQQYHTDLFEAVRRYRAYISLPELATGGTLQPADLRAMRAADLRRKGMKPFTKQELFTGHRRESDEWEYRSATIAEAAAIAGVRPYVWRDWENGNRRMNTGGRKPKPITPTQALDMSNVMRQFRIELPTVPGVDHAYD